MSDAPRNPTQALVEPVAPGSGAPGPIICAFSGNEEPRISARIPFREPLRSEIAARIGAHSWQKWLVQQLRVINEYRLNLATPEARDVLESAARSFFGLGESSDAAAVPSTGEATARELGNLPAEGER